MNPADPMLLPTTATILPGVLSPISLMMENIYMTSQHDWYGKASGIGGLYVLMACISKHHDWQSAQRLNWTRPVDNANIAGVSVRIGSEMVDDQDNEVANRDESNNAGVFERVEPAQEAERDDEKHKSSDPEVAVNKIGKVFSVVCDALHDARHQVANDDHI